MYSIGELANKTGVKIPTIRYYEKIGLIAEPHRSEGNQRRYEKEGLERLLFIKHARQLGLSLEDIHELIQLSSKPEQSCKSAHDIANRHLEMIKQKIANLKRLQKELKRISSLSDKGHVGECKLIEALADHSLCSGEH